MTGGFGITPWGSGPWGSGGGGIPTALEHIPVTPVWNIFDLGGVGQTDINRLTDFIEVSTYGSSGQFFISSWNQCSGDVYPDTLCFTFFDVRVTETFTIEYNVKFNSLPEDFSDPVNSHAYLGAWSSQDFAAGFLFSKAGVAYTGEVSFTGSTLSYLQTIDIIPGSADWFPNVFGEGVDVTIRVVVDSRIPVLYLYITRTSELASGGHVLRALIQPKTTLPGNTDGVIVAIKGTVTDQVCIELINDYRMSSKPLIPNLAPIAIAGNDQAVRLCSVAQLDGSESFDPEGETVSYEWRLIDVPEPSMFGFSSTDGVTETTPSGYANTFFSDALGVEHAREPIQVNDVLMLDGVGYTIKSISVTLPFNVDIEYSQLPASKTGLKFKLVRQVGLNTRSSEKPTFFPDVLGFYLFDLRVWDGSLWSSPLGMERSRVLLDVRESPLPRACKVETGFIFNSLSSFWSLVEDRDRITAVWDGLAQATASELLTLWQHEYSKSLRDIQRQVIRRWLHYDLMIPEPVPELSRTKFMWGGVVSSRFETISVVGSTISVTTPFIGSPIEFELRSPGAVTPDRLAKELEVRLREQVSDEFRAEALELLCLMGGDNGVLVDTGNPLTNTIFTTSLSVDLVVAGAQVGDTLTLYESDGTSSTYTIASFTGVSTVNVSSPFPTVPRDAVRFTITRPGSAFGYVRVTAPFYFTFTSDSSLSVFHYPAANTIPFGLDGLWLSDRVFKTTIPVSGVEEDDLLVIGNDSYRVARVITASVDELEGQRLTLKDPVPVQTGPIEWSVPGWVSSELLNFYNGLIYRGDVVEFEAAQENAEVSQVDQLVELITTSALAANETRFDRLAIDTATLYSKLPAVDSVLRLARLVRRHYVPIDDSIVDVPTLQELIVIEDDQETLRRNVDYFLEAFRGFVCLRFQSGLSNDSGDVWEGQRPPDRLWAEYTYIDNEPVIEANFGAAIGVLREDVPDTVDYLSAVQGLWYAKYNGPTLRNVRIASQILLGLPFAEADGKVVEIREEFLSQRARLLIQDMDNQEIVRSYNYPNVLELELNPSTGERYAVGDVVSQFSPLVKGVDVVDYVKDPKWFEGMLNQGIFYEVQKYHTFLVQVDLDAFSLDALLETKKFVQTIKPVYTDPKFIVGFNVSGDGDEIDVQDRITFYATLTLDDSICREKYGASFRFDEPWASGARNDAFTGNSGGNVEYRLANTYRNRFDTADSSPLDGIGAGLPSIYPPTPDAEMQWAFDKGGYLCPNDQLDVVVEEYIEGATPGSSTPMVFDSIFSFDVGQTYVFNGVTYYGPVGPGSKLLASDTSPFIIPDAPAYYSVPLTPSTESFDGNIAMISLAFMGDTDSTPDPDHAVDELNRTYEIVLLINGSVATGFPKTEVLNINSEVIYELNAPVLTGEMVEIQVRSPSGQGTKTPEWTSITGFVIYGYPCWEFDLGETYPAHVPPPPSGSLYPAGTYCALIHAGH